MSIEKLHTLLMRRGLWLARLDQFGTPAEGSLPVANQMGLLSMYPTPSAAWLKTQYESGVQRSYASCWHARNDNPAQEVWAEFDKAGQGVAVSVEFNDLIQQLNKVAPCVNAPPSGGGGPIHVGAVTYIDHQSDSVPDGNVLEAQFVVKKKWSYQSELRVLIHTHGTNAYERLYNKRGPLGPIVVPVTARSTELMGGHLDGRALVLPVDPKRLVRLIIPNKKMRPCSKLRLVQLAARTGMLCRIKWS